MAQPFGTGADWVTMAPAITLALTAMLLFIVNSISPNTKNRPLLVGLSTLGTVVAGGIAVAFLATGTGEEAVSLYDGALVVDTMSLFFTLIFTSVTVLVCIASYDYMKGQPYMAEFYSLVILATTGMTLMASANSLATVFVSLELASLPSYALVAILKKNRGSVEAGLKYFLIGALSSAIFAYGISLVYGVTGHLQLEAVASNLNAEAFPGVLGIGVLMVLGGFAFKTASVPFHFWAPEAYEGAPAPVSAFLSSASKAAGFVVAFRVFVTAFPIAELSATVDWVLAFQILAVVTMTLGNFAAATQDKVKRMLAYSSVGHAGYALIGLAALTGVGGANDLVMGGAMLHLLVYGFMNTGAFLFIALVEQWGIGRTFEDYNGLGSKAPMACLAMTVFMFNLAGLPVGAGFMSKYALFTGAVGAGFWWLAAVGAINSALSLYYYSRVVKAMWVEEPTSELTIRSTPTGLYVAVLAAAVTSVVLLPAFGPLADTAYSAAATLFA
ncbi:NADH-quinone oxidoreductase subunit N [Haladaptatus cibarius]|uniref:NADH-quinone oxidoreductase subunit N n=1 Tax=Haladaptatus cibarius TaxID=453847 RepID=UPI0006796D8C|nr:NADH-quinone oxidoreductase subunit N [Haladaptatus cibarius]